MSMNEGGEMGIFDSVREFSVAGVLVGIVLRSFILVVWMVHGI